MLLILFVLFGCTASQLTADRTPRRPLDHTSSGGSDAGRSDQPLLNDASQGTPYKANHLIDSFYKTHNGNHQDSYRESYREGYRDGYRDSRQDSPAAGQYFDNRPISSNPIETRNAALHSISDTNNDHNFESIEQRRSPEARNFDDLSAPSSRERPMVSRKARSISPARNKENSEANRDDKKDNEPAKVFVQSTNQSSNQINHKSNETMPINNTTRPPTTALNQFFSLTNSSLLLTLNDSQTARSPSTLPLLSSPGNSSTESGGPDQFYKDLLTSTRFWVQRIASPVVILIGVIGNSMTIIIMTRKRMRSSTNVYLAFLATVDMLYLSLTFILSLKHYPGVRNPTGLTRIYWRLTPIFMMIADACTNCSVWLTAAFTIERFIVVSNPIRGKALCTESRARKLCLSIFAFCTAFVFPVPFEWDIIETENKDKVKTLGMKPSELGDNTTYKNVYYWLTSVLFIFVPLAFLIVFNSFLIRSVHLSRKERATMTNTQTAKSKKKEAKKRKSEAKQAKAGKQEFVCKLQLDANNNDKDDNPTTSNRLEINSASLQSASDSNLQMMGQPNGQQQASSQSANNLQPTPASAAASKSLLTQRRLSDNPPSTESRRTSASSPTAATKSGSAVAASSNRIEQQSAKQETKITIMLISVVILFLVCQLPVAVNLIYTSVRNIPEDSQEFYIVYAFNNFLNLMVAINAAGNFVLYCLLSQKYRKTMLALFCPCFKSKRLRKSTAQQATIYSTLTTTTNQYHHSPSSTTGFQGNKSASGRASNEPRRSNECRANSKNKPAEREEPRQDGDASKQTDAGVVQLSSD